MKTLGTFFGKEINQKSSKLKSDCCGVAVQTHYSYEGTGCYLCLKCEKACDPSPKEKNDLADLPILEKKKNPAWTEPCDPIKVLEKQDEKNNKNKAIPENSKEQEEERRVFEWTGGKKSEHPIFKKGDNVIMVRCLEAQGAGNEKVWICRNDSFKSCSREEVVFLENYSGYFSCKFLELVTPQPEQKAEKKCGGPGKCSTWGRGGPCDASNPTPQEDYVPQICREGICNDSNCPNCPGSDTPQPESEGVDILLSWKKELIRFSQIKNPIIHIALLIEKLLEAQQRQILSRVKTEYEKYHKQFDTETFMNVVEDKVSGDPTKEDEMVEWLTLTETEKNDQLLVKGLFVMNIPLDFAEFDKSKWPKEVPSLDSAWAYVIKNRVKRLLAAQAKQIRMEERVERVKELDEVFDEGCERGKREERERAAKILEKYDGCSQCMGACAICFQEAQSKILNQ